MSAPETTTRFFLAGWSDQMVVEFDADDNPIAWGQDIDGLADMRTDNLDRVAQSIASGEWRLFA